MQTTATNAAKAERARIAAIYALPETKGNESLAMSLAMTTSLSVDEVKATLAAETSALWGAALASRGMKVEGAKAAADPWDIVLREKGMVGA